MRRVPTSLTKQPFYLTVIDDVMSFLTLNVQAGDVAQAVAQIEEKWKQVAPDVPFDYFFLDARFDEQYRDEMRFGALFDYFAVLRMEHRAGCQSGHRHCSGYRRFTGPQGRDDQSY